MGITLVATSIVCLTSILAHIGLASTIIIALKEFYAHVSLTIGVVPAITIIALVYSCHLCHLETNNGIDIEWLLTVLIPLGHGHYPQ